MADGAEKCQFCSYTAANLSHLHDHVMAVHFHLPDFACDVCEYKTSRGYAVLNVHKKTVHAHGKNKNHSLHHKRKKKAIVLQEEAPRHPSVRPDNTRQSSLHEDTKKQIVTYQVNKCTQCSFKSYRKSKLDSHINEAHGTESKHTCDNCSYAANTKVNLEEHKKTAHEKMESYWCLHCEFKSALRFKLNRHQKKAHGNLGMQPFAQTLDNSKALPDISYNLRGSKQSRKIAEDIPEARNRQNEASKRLGAQRKALFDAVEDAKRLEVVRKNGLIKEELNDDERKQNKEAIVSPATLKQEDSGTDTNPTSREIVEGSNTTHPGSSAAATATGARPKRSAAPLPGTLTEEATPPPLPPCQEQNEKDGSERVTSGKRNRAIHQDKKRTPKDGNECHYCTELKEKSSRLTHDLAAAEKHLEAEQRLRKELETKLAKLRKPTRITPKTEPPEPPENPDEILGY